MKTVKIEERECSKCHLIKAAWLFFSRMRDGKRIESSICGDCMRKHRRQQHASERR